MALINVNNIYLSYEKINVLSNLSFSVYDNDYLCIIGDNGTGKTTLMRSLLGLKRVSEGEITFNNINKNQIGYLAQQSDLQKDFPATVKEIVLSGCINRNGIYPFYTTKDKKNAIDAMNTLGILDLKEKCYRELSGGQQQRVLLARAICSSKKLIFLDEPTTGLDPAMTTEFFSLIKKMNEDLSISVVMVTHDTYCASKYSKHILYLHDNSYFYGETKDFFNTEEGRNYIRGHKHD